MEPDVRAASAPSIDASRASLPGELERLAFLKTVVAPAGVQGDVEVVETHLSWVVLGPDRVLKMKKWVQGPLVDLSPLAARERNAREEVRLNRRLAPDVYLGVLALQWDGARLSLLPGDALRATPATVDWLVSMTRLPASLMLDRMASERTVSLAQVDTLASTLSAFHAAAPRAGLRPTDYLLRIAGEQHFNRTVLMDARATVPDAEATLAAFDATLSRCAGLLSRRASEDRIVEGHGDLRPEHVCLLRPPVVIDCLEFDATLREIDPFDELAFLGLECAQLGAPWIGHRLWQQCAAHLRDPAPEPLRLLYTARRALLRARLMAAHLLDSDVREPLRWRSRAGRYLADARASMQRLGA